MIPVPGYKITTAYGVKGKLWPTCGYHTGVDYGAPRGTPVCAPISGQIRHRTYGAAFGPFQFAISPDPGEPFGSGEVFFAHVLDRLPDGTRVTAGQQISHVGNLGNTTGYHLHMEYMPSTKNIWKCGVHADPALVIAWAPKPAWMFPAGTKVFEHMVKFNGHEQNPDKVSDSIKAVQEMLTKHGYPVDVTGKYWTATDEAVRKCQADHVPPADPPLKSYVGPKQFAHMKAATGCPYVWVAEDAMPPPEPEQKPVAPPAPWAMPAGAVWEPVPKKDGGWFTGLGPFTGSAKKITLHTTETAAKPNWAAMQSGIPHYTVMLETKQVWMHLPMTVAAYTMQGGEHSPNSESGSNIQIEVVGFAKDTIYWPQESYDFLGGLLRWIGAQTGAPYEFPRPFPPPGDQSARMSWEEWEPVSGVLGHSHAPYNDHTDPGTLCVQKMPGVQPDTGDDDLPLTRGEFRRWLKRTGISVDLM